MLTVAEPVIPNEPGELEAVCGDVRVELRCGAEAGIPAGAELRDGPETTEQAEDVSFAPLPVREELTPTASWETAWQGIGG